MLKVEYLEFSNQEELVNTINKVCDYLENLETKVHISNHYSEGLDSGIGFNNILSIDDLRNMKKIAGFIDIEGGEYSIAMSNVSMSYFKLKE